MAKDKAEKAKSEALGKTDEIKQSKSPNDGMNTPVPDSTSTSVPSESEAALIKQANNPLGDPDKI